MPEAAIQTRYRVEGMDRASCATKIDTAVRRMPDVADVAVSVTAGTMLVQHDASSDLSAIQKKVTGLGYSLAPMAAKVTAASASGARRPRPFGTKARGSRRARSRRLLRSRP